MSEEDKTPERMRIEKWSAENPRDEFALELFAGWVNCSVDKLPPEMKGHTCPATMVAWARVADAARAYLCDPTQDERVRALEAENARLLDAATEAAKQLRVIAGMDLIGASAVAYNAARDLEAALRALEQGDG